MSTLTNWLNDSVIDACLSLLVRTYGKETDCWLSCLAATQIAQDLDRNFKVSSVCSSSYQLMIVLTHLQNATRVFFAYNVSKIHWVLYVVSVDTAAIECFDSMALPLPPATEKFLHFFRSRFPGKWAARAVASPEQLDFNNCGVFTLLNAAAALLKKKLRRDMKVDVVRARSWIQCVLLAGECPPAGGGR